MALEATGVWFTWQTDKDVYQPGESIQIHFMIGSDDSPQGSGATSIYFSADGGGDGTLAKTYPVFQFPMGKDDYFTITAPATPGPFALRIFANLNKYYGQSDHWVSANSPGIKPISLSVAAPAAPVVDISANPISLVQGGSSTLTWNAINATGGCIASGDWSGNESVPGTQVVTPASAGIYNYTLTCIGLGGSGQDTASVTVLAAPCVMTCDAGVRYSLASNQAVDTFNCLDGSRMVINPPATIVGGNCTPNGLTLGTFGPMPQPGVTCVQDAACVVAPATCPNGANNPSACNQCPSGRAWVGGSTGSCEACNGGCTGGGSSSSNPGGSLVCTNGASNPPTCAAAALSPIVNISANPTRLPIGGGSSTITWSSQDVVSCTVSGPGLSSSLKEGSQVVNIITQSTYTITCLTATGTVVKSTVVVNVQPKYQEF